jgi:hypothetical protein
MAGARNNDLFFDVSSVPKCPILGNRWRPLFEHLGTDGFGLIGDKCARFRLG